MKFTKRHLVVSTIFLAASIVYNVWVFWGGDAAGVRPRTGAFAGEPAGAAAPPALAAIDPAEIPAPPDVDLATPPTWDRDPFKGPAADAPAAAAAAAPPSAPEPKVRSILFSAERRLAIVDGRVVGIGDRLLTGATVVDIARDAVTLRMPSGEQKRLALRTSPGGAQ